MLLPSLTQIYRFSHPGLALFCFQLEQEETEHILSVFKKKILQLIFRILYIP